jgi:hypothetical protein
MVHALRWFGFWAVIGSLLGGCADEGVSPGGQVAGQDGGQDLLVLVPNTRPATPDTSPLVPDTGTVVLDGKAVVPEVPVVVPDAGTGSEVHGGQDAMPVVPDLRPADVLPALDSAPECPYVSWVKPPPGSSSEIRWTITRTVDSAAECFTTCGSLMYLSLGQLPMRSVKINGVSASAVPNDTTGSLPGVGAVDGLWVFRIGAGDPGTLVIAGWPANSTGSCP